MDRDRRLLRHLATNEGWTTSSTLAAELGCSVRTVKSDVAKLNNRWPGIVQSSRKGFALGDRALLAEVDPAGANPMPQSSEERRSAILRALLMGHRQVSLEDLADELCVSSVTLTKDLARVKLDMAEYGLEVHSRGGILQVSGGEANEKRMVSSLIFDETKGFFSQVDMVRGYFPDLDMQGMRESISQALERHQLFLNDYALANLMLHVAIVLERNLNGFGTPEDGGQPRLSLEPDVESLVRDICDAMERRYATTISEADRASFGVIVSTRLETKHSDTAEFVGDKALDLVRQTASRVYDEYGVKLEGEAFLIRFGLHLKNMIQRMSHDLALRNPQTTSIRNDYPFVYDIAVFIAQELRRMTGVVLPDDEIAYIALHIGCLIEEQNVERSKVRCVLMSPSYNASGISLAWRILRSFEELLVIDGVVDSVSRLPEDFQPDLLITSMPLATTPPYPVVEISPFLGERDLATLRAHLEMVRSAKRRQKMERRLRRLFSRELFFCGERFGGREDAIEVMGDALIAGGYARNDYKERLREREAISSSAYLDVALPHPLDMNALRTAIAVSVHPEGLNWAGTNVHLVFMLAIHPEDKPVFRQIFDFVTEALFDPRHMTQVAAAESFEEFLDTLLSYA